METETKPSLCLLCTRLDPSASVAYIEFTARQIEGLGALRLLCHEPPSVHCLVFEDAMRYLAAQLGASFTVSRGA